MKDSNGYGLYYLIIVFLIVMIGIPPLLRVLIPNEKLNNTNNNKNNNTEKVDDKIDQKDNNTNNVNGNNLTCNIMNPLDDNKDLINVVTEYKDDEVVSLKIMYDSILLQDNNSSQLDITKLKDVKGSSFDDTSNTITFDFSNNSVDKTKLEQFLNKPSDQKKYYENLGFTCVNK